MPSVPHQPLSPTDYHVLLALANGEQYGYAIMKAIDDESGGVVAPEIGSLYRVLARLMGDGLVCETNAPKGAPTVHRGRPRRYYRLSAAGRRVLAAESARLYRAMQLARTRKILPDMR